MSARGGSPHQDVLKALNHPLRRRILRSLHDGGGPRSPIQLSRALRVPVSNVSYHVRVLRDRGVVALVSTRPVRGSSEHFYASSLAGNAVAVQLLESTAAEDLVP
jgi:DNA-binding transcriptional ArsR family regulator